MLARQRRRPEFPVNLAGRPIDHDHGRDVAEAQQQIAVGHLRRSVGVRPLIAVIHGCRDGVFAWVEMLPGSPLPDNLPRRRHLDEIICIHFAVVVFGAWQPAAHLPNYFIGNRLGTDQENVAVAQAQTIVMMVVLPDFPENLSFPIDFERRAALEWRLPEVARIGDSAVVEERPGSSEVAVKSGWVGHFPGVNEVALHIDEINRFVSDVRRSKQSKA